MVLARNTLRVDRTNTEYKATLQFNVHLILQNPIINALTKKTQNDDEHS